MQRSANLTILLVLIASPVLAGTLYDEPRGPSLQYQPALGSFTYLGIRFALDQPSQITTLHTELALVGDGSSSFFAALVRLPTVTSLPRGNPFIAEEIVHSEIFDLAGDSLHPVSIPFPVTVGPGAYAVVLGAGLFGSTESVGFAGYYEPMPDSSALTWSSFRPDPPYTPWADNAVGTFRMTVEGVAVPEPSPFAFCLGSLALFGWLRHGGCGRCLCDTRARL